MADPVTATFMALQGVSSLAAGSAARGQARTEAEAEAIATEQKVEQHTDKIVGLLGQQRAAYVGSGVKLSGSALNVIEETRKKGMEDIRRIKSMGAKRSQSLLLGGDAAMARGVGSAIGSFGSIKMPTASKPGLLGPSHL